jgi:UDP-N-acetylglucosamine 2-epimerase (non-hydrolysing)
MNSDPSIKVMFILGTRPEVIKVAPVIKAAARYGDRLETVVCLTAQHRDMTDSLVEYFGIVPDHDLDVMVEDQSIFHVVTRSLSSLDEILSREQPHLIVVQGDTTTTFTVSLAGFYHRIPVGHIEAGLRTYERYFPFPEEKHRQITSILATYHYAPTEGAKQNLLREGIDPARVRVTGNPVIDALDFVVRKGPLARDPLSNVDRRGAQQLLLVTAHRRESIGAPLEGICRAVLRLVEGHPGLRVVFPVHPNPKVSGTVTDILSGHSSISIVEPFLYPDFVHTMIASDLIMTDSGGIQEEASYLGKRVLLLRDFTERPEAVEEGFVTIAGRDEEEILDIASGLLDGPAVLPAGDKTVFGDGRASSRIIEHILECAGELSRRELSDGPEPKKKLCILRP